MGNYRIANPFGAMDARKTSNSIKANAFSTFCHSTILSFARTSLRLAAAELEKKKTCVTQGLKVPPFRAKLNFDTPKGVMNLRKTSHSTTQMLFRHFVIQRFCFLSRNKAKLLNDKMSKKLFCSSHSIFSLRLTPL